MINACIALADQFHQCPMHYMSMTPDVLANLYNAVQKWNVEREEDDGGEE